MSDTSFPRTEHVVLLGEKIATRLQERNLPLEVAERGINHHKCQYRFGFRRNPEQNWVEVAIHFQVAERLAVSQSDAALNRILDPFLNRHFP